MRVGDGRDHHVVLPAGQRPPLEVIEAKLGFQFLVLLLDGPPLMRETRQRRHAGMSRQVAEVILRPRAALAEQPHFVRAFAAFPFCDGRDAHRQEVGLPRRVRPVLPADVLPDAQRIAVGEPLRPRAGGPPRGGIAGQTDCRRSAARAQCTQQAVSGVTAPAAFDWARKLSKSRCVQVSPPEP